MLLSIYIMHAYTPRIYEETKKMWTQLVKKVTVIAALPLEADVLLLRYQS